MTTTSRSAVALRKYTSSGNTFLIVDEGVSPLSDDADRASFARWALNGDFGVGGTDNVLYLRPVDDPAEPDGADYAFRIFEIDGSETLSCGNGLLATAAFLHETTGGTEWTVLTELPTGEPKPVGVGISPAPDLAWVNVGRARPVPGPLLVRTGPPPESGIDWIEGLTVTLPPRAGWAAGLPRTIELSGGLTFTGEPHWVITAGRGAPDELTERIFPAIGGVNGPAGRMGGPESPVMRASRALVHHLGATINTAYRDLFPQGVHLNFARVLGPDTVESRTWERAIDRETLACGSGTVAMAHVLGETGLVSGARVTFLPHRCRWFQPDACLLVDRTDQGFVLTGHPLLVCTASVPRTPESSAGTAQS